MQRNQQGLRQRALKVPQILKNDWRAFAVNGLLDIMLPDKDRCYTERHTKQRYD